MFGTRPENLKRQELRLLIVSDRLPEDLRLAVTFSAKQCVAVRGGEFSPTCRK